MLVALQILPLPGFLVGAISPRVFEDKTLLAGLIGDGSGQGTGSSWMTTGYSVHPVIVEWKKLATYIGMFFLVLNSVKTKRGISVVIWVLIGLGLFEKQ